MGVWAAAWVWVRGCVRVWVSAGLPCWGGRGYLVLGTCPRQVPSLPFPGQAHSTHTPSFPFPLSSSRRRPHTSHLQYLHHITTTRHPRFACPSLLDAALPDAPAVSPLLPGRALRLFRSHRPGFVFFFVALRCFACHRCPLFPGVFVLPPPTTPTANHPSLHPRASPSARIPNTTAHRLAPKPLADALFGIDAQRKKKEKEAGKGGKRKGTRQFGSLESRSAPSIIASLIILIQTIRPRRPRHPTTPTDRSPSHASERPSSSSSSHEIEPPESPTRRRGDRCDRSADEAPVVSPPSSRRFQRNPDTPYAATRTGL